MEKKKQLKTFEVLFKDSPEYFYIENARMFTEGAFVRFVLFNEDGSFKKNQLYPLVHVHRIEFV